MSGQPSFAEWVCLALVADGSSHGWAVGTELAPDGPIGRIWSLSRPLTYRALDGLAARGYLTRVGERAGRGGSRTVLAITAAGRRAVRRWLDQPVEHLRDVRTELLVKLALRDRASLDRDSLLAAQRDQFAATLEALTTPQPDEDLVDIWRRESARAVDRFLARAMRPTVEPAPRPLGVRLSARNQIRAEVHAVRHGAVMSSVEAGLPDGQRLTASITRDAAVDLDLAPGDDVVLIVKSTEVMVATFDP